ncbi:hypothetical protein [uncultured Bradyrhizobium sp.]|uniref:hyaluronate lyase N-terminal domain-containing protein n=1 Tax=uncultured Bradyrhizobium sp. TaxID=199684 RepID=UPI0035CA52DE
MTTATQVKRRRGTTSQHTAFTGADGEITIDTTTHSVVVHDGATAGGFRQATESYVQAQVATLAAGNFQNQFLFANTIYP